MDEERHEHRTHARQVPLGQTPEPKLAKILEQHRIWVGSVGWTPEPKLAKILEQHRIWVGTNGKDGARAVLSEFYFRESSLQKACLNKADLRGADLQEANLQEADLCEADLRGTNLHGADLRGAILVGAKLEGADLRDANIQQKTDLCGADLRGADLQGADLQEAQLYKANLAGAKVYQANFQGANLAQANLKNIHLLETNLRETNLQDADLSEATGLSSRDLAGADVSGAKLPAYIPEFKGLDIIGEASRNARRTFAALLLGCLFSWLSIATTTDVGLLTNSVSSPLPIIQTDISIAGFYWAAPLVLLGLYLYLHLYMQRLWEALAAQPARFPDGKPLDERAYPWLLIGLVRAHFKRLRDKRPPLSRLQTGIATLLTYCVVPLTLALFWGRYLTRHEWWGTGLHIALLVIAIGSAIVFHRLTRRTLRAQQYDSLRARWQKAFEERGKVAACIEVTKRALLTPAALALGVGVIFYFLSWGAIEGVPPHRYSEGWLGPSPPTLEPNDIRRWVPRALATMIGYSPFANLKETEVSTKPPNWTGDEEKEEYEIPLVKGASLAGIDLRYADAYGAFLVNADLSGADLRSANLVKANLSRADLRLAKLGRANREVSNTDIIGADLSRADLRGADLSQADLTGAWLLDADMREATLSGANLSFANLYNAQLQNAGLNEAKLHGADLEGARLIRADLSQADLTGTWLDDADLRGANLEGADLRKAEALTTEQVKAASNWPLACYSENLLEGLGLRPDHNERVQKKEKDLRGYQLPGADLTGAGLSDADLRGANLHRAILLLADLRGANLHGANLRGAILVDAKLEDADLWDADLEGANLRGAEGLTAEQVKAAQNWERAFYSEELREKLGLPLDHNEQLEKELARGERR